VGNEEEAKRRFPFAVKVAGGVQGGGARLVTAAPAPALFGAGVGRKKTGSVGPKRSSGLASPLG
jgi:hypothetical protein